MMLIFNVRNTINAQFQVSAVAVHIGPDPAAGAGRGPARAAARRHARARVRPPVWVRLCRRQARRPRPNPRHLDAAAASRQTHVIYFDCFSDEIKHEGLRQFYRYDWPKFEGLI